MASAGADVHLIVSVSAIAVNGLFADGYVSPQAVRMLGKTSVCTVIISTNGYLAGAESLIRLRLSPALCADVQYRGRR